MPRLSVVIGLALATAAGVAHAEPSGFDEGQASACPFSLDLVSWGGPPPEGGPGLCRRDHGLDVVGASSAPDVK